MNIFRTRPLRIRFTLVQPTIREHNCRQTKIQYSRLGVKNFERIQNIIEPSNFSTNRNFKQTHNKVPITVIISY